MTDGTLAARPRRLRIAALAPPRRTDTCATDAVALLDGVAGLGHDVIWYRAPEERPVAALDGRTPVLAAEIVDQVDVVVCADEEQWHLAACFDERATRVLLHVRAPSAWHDGGWSALAAPIDLHVALAPLAAELEAAADTLPAGRPRPEVALLGGPAPPPGAGHGVHAEQLAELLRTAAPVDRRHPALLDAPELTVVVLAWDGIEHTRRCVDSIRRRTDVPYELVIVDNGSRWEARHFAAMAADRAVLHEANHGFSGGHNAGLALARGGHIAFANNDVVFPQGWAARLLETARDYPRFGIVTPVVTSAAVPRTVRSQPGDRVEVLLPFEQPPSAVCHVMATEVARRLGGWDERYHPASGEDLEMAFRVWANGLDVVVDERVLVHHVGKGTTREKLPRWRSLWRDNGEIFLARWTSPELVVPRLDECTPADHERNVRTARAAAGWMARYYSLREHQYPGKRLARMILDHLWATRSAAHRGVATARALTTNVRARQAAGRSGWPHRRCCSLRTLLRQRR